MEGGHALEQAAPSVLLLGPLEAEVRVLGPAAAGAARVLNVRGLPLLLAALLLLLLLLLAPPAPIGAALPLLNTLPVSTEPMPLPSGPLPPPAAPLPPPPGPNSFSYMPRRAFSLASDACSRICAAATADAGRASSLACTEAGAAAGSYVGVASSTWATL